MMRFRENPESQNPLFLQNRIDTNSQQRCVALLEQIAKGDESAFGSLYQETSPLVFGLILRIIADHTLAEEVLLAVFKQVWKEAALFDAQRLAPLAWILTMARSRALDYLRSASGEYEFESPISQTSQLIAPQTELETGSDFSQQRELAQAALAMLSSTQRQVFELAYFGGLSPGAIASRLELPLITVKKHLKFAMMRLREFFSPVLQEQL